MDLDQTSSTPTLFLNMYKAWYGFLVEKLNFDELSLFQNFITPMSSSNSSLEAITGKKARCKRNT